MLIKDVDEDLVAFLCRSLWVEEEDASESLFSKRIYKGTDCGAWLAFENSKTITLGSIVEGVDFGTEVHTLVWPFTKEDFWEALEAIEDEARYIWDQTHGCEDCNTEGEWGHQAINPNCKTCEGEGSII